MTAGRIIPREKVTRMSCVSRFVLAWRGAERLGDALTLDLRTKHFAVSVSPYSWPERSSEGILSHHKP